MSHPENTLRQIIERQDKKIDELIKIFGAYIITMKLHNNIMDNSVIDEIVKDLYEIRNLK